MRFRLTYEGPLYSTQGEPRDGQAVRPKLADHKHQMRREFHNQLKELWATNKFLSTHRVPTNEYSQEGQKRPIAEAGSAYYGVDLGTVPMAEAIASKYEEFGYRFVPLVREEICLLCSLDILFLRRDIPGGVLSKADLDNRIKTLIDALRRPVNPSELAGNEMPQDGEEPFYCLLEDDSQVTHLAVETDTLLDKPYADKSEVKLVITVDLRPYYATMFNLSFA